MPPVRFQLRLTGASGSHRRFSPSGSLTYQMCPHAGQPGEQVLILCKLYLQLSFPGPCPLGKDIQDQSGAVQHPDPEPLLQNPHLGGREFVVEHRKITLIVFGIFPQFFHFSISEKRSRIRRRAVLQQHADGLRAGGLDQFFQFFHGLLAGSVLLVHAGCCKTCQHCLF